MSGKLISREEAAEYLGIAPSTLATWASTGARKVPYIKIGGRVKYRISDLESFVEANLLNPPKPDERR